MDCELKGQLFDADAIAKRIREVRGDLTQRQMADMCFLSQGVISLYERGRIPETPALFLICEAFNVNAYWIMYGAHHAKYSVKNG